jgi:hypothetical protein
MSKTIFAERNAHPIRPSTENAPGQEDEARTVQAFMEGKALCADMLA